MKIRNITRNYLKDFEKTALYDSLRKLSVLKKMRHFIRESFPYKVVLHGDIILQKLFLELIKKSKATSLIETGTYYGWSIGFLASKFPNLNFYTCELNKKYHKKAKKNLKNLKNTHLIRENSPIFLKKILSTNKLGNIPLFYLDAHWGDEWPLKNELKIISEELNSAIFVIDDFKVPENPQFSFDKYKNEECSLEMIKSHLSKKNTYSFLFPVYTEKEAFKENVQHTSLTGYIIILQNLPRLKKELESNNLIKSYFRFY